MLPEEFLKYFLKEKLNAKFVVIGADWRFGKNRSGDAALLKAYEDKYCYSSYVIEKETYNNTEISSTWIRNEIEKSDLSTVKNFWVMIIFQRESSSRQTAGKNNRFSYP